MKLSSIVFGLAFVSIVLCGAISIYHTSVGEDVDVPCYDGNGNEIKDLVCEGNENRDLASAYVFAGIVSSIFLFVIGLWLDTEDL